VLAAIDRVAHGATPTPAATAVRMPRG